MYTAYVTAQRYTELGYNTIPLTPVGTLDKTLKEASRNVDTLTFNRIVRVGFDKLSEFQKEVVEEVVCRQADFLYENEAAISSVLDSYSINGVAMQFGTGFNVMMDGVPIQRNVYSLLEQTGLCCRLAR